MSLRAVRLLLAFLLASVALGMFAARPQPDARLALGVTFSTVYARQLGLDPFEVYAAVLDDLRVRTLRIPLYWSDMERDRGTYAFDEADRFLAQAAAHGARVTLVVGRKVPRFPECFVPDWAMRLPEDQREAALFAYIEAVVRHFSDAPALERWQVENEPFFPFGICPTPSHGLFERELALVRSLDAHPIQVTMSGEAEPWKWAAQQADVLGISLYRITWNPVLGYFIYPLPPAYYALRATAVSRHAPVIISELQAEPWFPEPVSSRTPESWERAFDADALRGVVAYARQTGLSEASLWGVEWWYFLKMHGRPALWEAARALFNEAVL